jgi:hypothetical protein
MNHDVLENLALRHQIGVLQRSARKRPKLTPGGPAVVGLAIPHLDEEAESSNPYSSTRLQLC